MNKLTRIISDDGYIKLFILNSSQLTEEAQAIHKTSNVAAAALGRTLTAALLMAADLKNINDRISVQFRSRGAIGSVIAEADAGLKVKGFVSEPSVELPLRADGKLDVGGALGRGGTLTIVKDIGMKEPYVGTVEIQSGEIAEDISYYYAQSEQIPTVMGLGVLLSPDKILLGAGGYMLQLMPGAPDNLIDILEKNISETDISVSRFFAENKENTELAAMILKGIEYRVLSEDGACFKCSCSRYRVEQALMSLGCEELKRMMKEDEETNVNCHYCNSNYVFGKEDLQVLINVSERMKNIKQKTE